MSLNTVKLIDPVAFDAFCPIGTVISVETHLVGSQEPDPRYFIRLRAGLTGSGQYNEGKLTSENSSGSAPLVVSTADIDDVDSPLYGQTINLLETEERFLRPGGTIGSVQNDQGQGHNRDIWNGISDQYAAVTTGSSRGYADQMDRATTAPGGVSLQLRTKQYLSDGTNGTPRIGNETRTKNIRVATYLRYK